jgi:hypothetical protein
MIYIEQNALNKIFVDVSYATGSTPDFLWNLKNSQGMNVKNFIPRDITATYPSQYAGKYNVFEFSTIPTLPENLTPTGTSVVNIHLPNLNQFWLGIHEQNGIINLNPTLSPLVLNSLAFSFWDKTNEYYSGNTGNTADNVIYYAAGAGVSPTPTASETPTPTPTITASETPTPTPTITPSPTIPAFNVGDGFDGGTTSIFIDGSDNIFVGGVFYGYDETASIGALVKLDTTGAIDTTFNTGFSSTLPNVRTSIWRMVDDETGDYIYVVGSWGGVPGRIVKIDKATGLNVWSAQTLNQTISSIAVDSITGDVYIVGNFTSVNGNTRNRIAHFNSAGVLQPTFTGTSFNSAASNIIINRNGNLVITGQFTTYNGVSVSRLIEIERTTYTNTGFWGSGTTNFSMTLSQRQDNGEYILVGEGTPIKGISVGKVSKWTEAGVNIPFTTIVDGDVPALLYLDEVNDLIYVSNQVGVGIRRLNYDTGNTDTTFESNIGSTLPIPAYTSTGSRFVIQLDSNNKIYWVGTFVFVNGTSFNRIVRLNQNGTINTLT